MKIAISIGGSLITNNFTSENIKKYADVLRKLKRKGHRIMVVVGGGKTARDYINIGKGLTNNHAFLDQLGILATHLNALLLICALDEDVYPFILDYVDEIAKAMPSNKILVCGGGEPGHSTDWDAALFAEFFNADLLINATTSDGVYDSDPKKNPHAKKFKRLNYDQLFQIMEQHPQEPGKYALFDLAAINLIKRSKIKTIIIDGNDPEEILRAVEGKHNGTEIFG